MTIQEIQQLADQISGTRRDLAARLNVDESTLSRWLSGAQVPQHPGMLGEALRSIQAEQALAMGNL